MSCPGTNLASGSKDKGARHVPELNSAVAVIGIDIGKNSFHVVGLDDRGAIVLRQKWSRGQLEARLANIRRRSQRRALHKESRVRRQWCQAIPS